MFTGVAAAGEGGGDQVGIFLVGDGGDLDEELGRAPWAREEEEGALVTSGVVSAGG